MTVGRNPQPATRPTLHTDKGPAAIVETNRGDDGIWGRDNEDVVTAARSARCLSGSARLPAHRSTVACMLFGQRRRRGEPTGVHTTVSVIPRRRKRRQVWPTGVHPTIFETNPPPRTVRLSIAVAGGAALLSLCAGALTLFLASHAATGPHPVPTVTVTVGASRKTIAVTPSPTVTTYVSAGGSDTWIAIAAIGTGVAGLGTLAIGFAAVAALRRRPQDMPASQTSAGAP
jgi:hypothetical protein